MFVDFVRFFGHSDANCFSTEAIQQHGNLIVTGFNTSVASIVEATQKLE